MGPYYEFYTVEHQPSNKKKKVQYFMCKTREEMISKLQKTMASYDYNWIQVCINKVNSRDETYVSKDILFHVEIDISHDNAYHKIMDDLHFSEYQ